MAIALGINLCTNGGVAIFCDRKDTADNILSRVLNIDKRGYDVPNITESSDDYECGRIANLIASHLGTDNDYYLMEDTFIFDGATTSLSNTYKLTIWVNENYEKNLHYSSSNNEQITTIGGETFNFKIHRRKNPI